MESAKKIGGRRRPAPTCGEVPASWLPEGTLQVPGAQEVLQTVPLPQIFLCGEAMRLFSYGTVPHWGGDGRGDSVLEVRDGAFSTPTFRKCY